MNYHLIIGYGYWSKKNLVYLKNKNIFDKIIIKTRKKYFYLSNGVTIKKDELNKILKKIKTVHICTPFKNHFSHLKQFSYSKKIIIEKPFLDKISELNKVKEIYKNKFLLVNYIDTFNPLINKIKKTLEKKYFYQITLNYSKQSKYYKNKNEFALEWLDHPLSLILLLFKKFPEFKIKVNQLRKQNNLFNNKIIINYNFKKFNLEIKLNCSKDMQRNIQIHKKKEVETFHFYQNSLFKDQKKIFQSKKSSFDNFYSILKSGKKNPTQNFEFHKKIILQRNKILKKLKKNKL